jgi:pyridinium-3,5-biscarboxylic acid mononucleotide sulfurtransferase
VSEDRAREARQQALDDALAGLGSLLVAYSGGVDSAYLAARAYRVLGGRMLAVTADSASLSEHQRSIAVQVAREVGFAHRLVPTRELLNPLYARNAPDRCYHCKAELFLTLRPLALAFGYAHVAYGLILDDLSDFRPGQRAAREAGALQPLADARLDKQDVRALSSAMGLPSAELPASPCLASRLAYGVSATAEALLRVERAEAGVRQMGFRELRVRDLGGRARVELARGELDRLSDPALRARVVAVVSEAGFDEVEIDPAGYRSGRLNEALLGPPAL